ncbi:hypothetical protein EIP91_004070 [Steccherinum ochraceum]|uniref:Uncharacterized protein n=1 Tax=Steccherinum ochraceum TaxID=92696 RepID=A0A4R0RC05_9APHY|nr:hypothetical protein EIP91_004070 [Steccherinum ochraceum]
MSTIAAIPPEILSIILELSCTDRAHAVASERPLGFTLGLVCKSFRRATQSCGLDIRYAYVCTVEKMRLFLALLEKRSWYARRVWSLMLAESEMIVQNIIANTALDLVAQILALIDSSSLRVLGIFTAFPYYAGAGTAPATLILPTRFPSLTDLFISGTYIDNPESSNLSPFLPNLTRAQILRMTVPPEHLPEDLARLAPNIVRLKLGIQANAISATHLAVPLGEYRVAMMERENRLDAIEAGEDYQALPPPSRIHTFPPNLRQLVVEFEPCYLPYHIKEGEASIKTMIESMDRGASMFERLRPSDYESDDEDEMDDEEDSWEHLVYGKMHSHRSTEVLVEEEQEKLRNLVQNWEWSTAGLRLLVNWRK